MRVISKKQVIIASFIVAVFGTLAPAMAQEGSGQPPATSPTPSPTPSPSASPDLKTRAEEIIATNCAVCHESEFSTRSGIEQAFAPLRLGDIYATGAMKEIQEGRMPVGDVLSGEDRDVLLKYVELLDTEKREKIAQSDRPIIQATDELQEALNFLRNRRVSSDGDAQYTRFISIRDLYNNQSLSDQDLDIARQGMIKAMNSVASLYSAQLVGLPGSPATYKLVAVDEASTLYAYDTRWFGWDYDYYRDSHRTDRNQIVNDLYSLDATQIQGDQASRSEFYGKTGTPYPIMSASRFALVATQAPFYDRLARIPHSLAELEHYILGTDVDRLVSQTAQQSPTARAEWLNSLDLAPDPVEFINTYKSQLQHQQLFWAETDFRQLTRYAEAKKNGEDAQTLLKRRADLLSAPVLFAITTNSGVSHSATRSAARFETKFGNYWLSFDNNNNSFSEQAPLPPRLGGYSYLGADFRRLEGKVDGGEVVWTGPNGMIYYLIVDANGNKIVVAPTGVVVDRRQKSQAVVTAQSCIACHKDGYKQYESTEGQTLLASQRFTRQEKEYINKFLVGTDALQAQLSRDTDTFKETLKTIGVSTETPNDPAFTYLVSPLLGENIDTYQAAADFGLSREELEQRLKGSTDLELRRLWSLLEGRLLAYRDYHSEFRNYSTKLGVDTARAAPHINFLSTNGGTENNLQLVTLVSTPCVGSENCELFGTPGAFVSVVFSPPQGQGQARLVFLNHHFPHTGQTTLAHLVGQLHRGEYHVMLSARPISPEEAAKSRDLPRVSVNPFQQPQPTPPPSYQPRTAPTSPPARRSAPPAVDPRTTKGKKKTAANHRSKQKRSSQIASRRSHRPSKHERNIS